MTFQNVRFGLIGYNYLKTQEELEKKKKLEEIFLVFSSLPIQSMPFQNLDLRQPAKQAFNLRRAGSA